MYREPLVEDEAWSNFESGLNNEKSKNVYTRNINEFMRYFDLHSYDELINTPVKDIQEMLKTWIKSHKDAGLKGNTINVKLSAVELLLDMNEIVWARKKIRKMVPRSDHEKGGKRPITTDEIQMLLKATNDFRMIAIIHFLASTGGRPAVLTDPPLKFKHLYKMSDDVYAVKIYDESAEGYWAFLTNEASNALDAYIRTRKLNGEHIDEESYLFATKQNARTRKNGFLSQQSVYKTLNTLYKKSGIIREKNGNRFDLAITYGFRKRFNGVLKMENSVNSNIAEKLMAHKRGLDGVYLQPTREECFKEFVKATPQLTVNPTERQKAELEEKQKKIDQLEAATQENSNLKNKLDSQEDRIGKLEKMLFESNFHPLSKSS
ncbi:MAG: hypothetical protein OEL69_02245 [Nitrosopumilus sp.]|nr:hypothetical protein [Nitrosopumilus sp.]